MTQAQLDARALAVSVDGHGTAGDLVSLLDIEPDFGAGIDDVQLAQARRAVRLAAVTLPAGAWDPGALDAPGAFAGLIVSGLMARDCRLADRTATQLLGPGDVMPVGEFSDPGPIGAVSCRVVTVASIVLLDQRFLSASQRWPWLTARLVARTATWADRALVLQAVSQLARVDARIVALMWHLADRWGRVSSDGLVVPLRLTHAAIGRLVGAQRPTVSLALKDLRDRGLMSRHGDGWLVARDSRDLLAPVAAVGLTTEVLHDGRLSDAREEARAARGRAAAARDEAQLQRDRARSMRQRT